MLKAFIKTHQESFLVGLAVLGLCLLAACYLWGITALTVRVNKAVNPGKGSQAVKQFDLEGAKKLNIQL